MMESKHSTLNNLKTELYGFENAFLPHQRYYVDVPQNTSSYDEGITPIYTANSQGPRHVASPGPPLSLSLSISPTSHLRVTAFCPPPRVPPPCLLTEVNKFSHRPFY